MNTHSPSAPSCPLPEDLSVRMSLSLTCAFSHAIPIMIWCATHKHTGLTSAKLAAAGAPTNECYKDMLDRLRKAADVCSTLWFAAPTTNIYTLRTTLLPPGHTPLKFTPQFSETSMFLTHPLPLHPAPYTSHSTLIMALNSARQECDEECITAEPECGGLGYDSPTSESPGRFVPRVASDFVG